MRVWAVALGVSIGNVIIALSGGSFEVAMGQVAGAFMVAATCSFVEAVWP